MPDTDPTDRRNDTDLTPLLAPRSIAVIGASDEPGNLGGVAVGYLRKFGFPGEVWPVNPKRSTVGDLPCFPSVADVPGTPDLAILAVQARRAAGLVRDCAAAGTSFGIVWAGGFAEVGGDGVELQDDLAAACGDSGFALLGPNCIGIIDSHRSMTASFASSLAEQPRLLPGDISMISQSGGLCTTSQTLAHQAGFGFRYTISTGNELTLTTADFIDALVADEQTKVIATYLEGVRDGRRLVGALEGAQRAGKPVVALKGGLAPAAARAATAHTGALAGEGRVWRAILDELGVLQVSSLEELLDVTLYLSSVEPHTRPSGNRLAVVTFGGGGGVLATDQAIAAGLDPAPLEEATREALRPLVPPIASVHNPLDLTPQMYNQPEYLRSFPKAMDVVVADPNVDMVLAHFGPMGVGAPELVDALADLRGRTDKTVCVSWTLPPSGTYERLYEQGFHTFVEPARAIGALGRLVGRDVSSGRTRDDSRAVASFDWAAYVDPVEGTVLTEHECHRMLAAAGLPSAPGRLVTSATEVDAAVAEVGLPVVMKGISTRVTHRDAAGLVRLGVDSAERADQAFADLTARASGLGIELDGVYVQHMVSGGREVLVSAFRDPTFGVMLSCGAGGTMTEAIDDVVLSRAPVDVDAARVLLGRLRMMQGLASPSTAGLDELAGFVASFSLLAAGAPWERFVLEVNPVLWTATEAVAVDGLLVVERP